MKEFTQQTEKEIDMMNYVLYDRYEEDEDGDRYPADDAQIIGLSPDAPAEYKPLFDKMMQDYNSAVPVER